MMDLELTDFLGRSPYERVTSNSNHRNGKYSRKLSLKGIGEVDLSVPRDRKNDFETKVFEKGRRYEKSLAEDLSLLFLMGCSTRSLSLISKRLVGRKLSHSEISRSTADVSEAVENWRLRDLSEEKIKYLYLDGVFFKMRTPSGVENVPVLVVLGVNEEGEKLVLSLQRGDKESFSTWREVLKDLKSRNLEPSRVKLGIMDGLVGLEKVFLQEFAKSKIQRCQVHVARNVLCKVTKKEKKAVADDMRSIFYASSRKRANQFYRDFVNKWKTPFPSAVQSLEKSLDSCLRFFSFPEEDWKALRTTNIIERLNKEFRRRTKTMEIISGEDSCYRLLASISLKMEMHWKMKPLGRKNKLLPNSTHFQFYTK